MLSIQQALAVHAGRDDAVLQLTSKHCKERVVTHLYLCLNARATAEQLAHHDTGSTGMTHAGRDDTVLQLTNKQCKERVVTHLYLCLNAKATAETGTSRYWKHS
eukprot:jgi/Chrzof1/4634/Cz14g20220.t1